MAEIDTDALFAELTDPAPAGERRPSALPGGRANREMLDQVWTALSTFIEKQIKQKKPVNIPNFGRFTFLVKSAKVKEPVFVWNPNFISHNGLKARSVPKGAIDPANTDVNFSMVAMLASMSKDDVSSVTKEIIRVIGQKMAASSEDPTIKVRVSLFNVGKICCDRGMCKIAMDSQWGCTRPGTSETCRTSASRGSLASRSGAVLGGTEGPLANSREMNAAMKGAIRRPSSSASQASSTGGGKVEGIKGPRRQGESEMLTIDELRDDVDDRFEDDAPKSLAQQVMEQEGDFNEGDVERMLEQRSGGSESQYSQSEYGSEMSSSSDVLPVYLCPEMTKSSRRIQRQKGIVANALNTAYKRYDHELKEDLRRVSRENQLFEAELRRQTHAANELRLWRKSNLMEMQKTHHQQMGEAATIRQNDTNHVNAPDPGYIASRKFVDDGRQKILDPHRKALLGTLHAQVDSKKSREEEEKAELVEYEQLQNELLMKDMELRQSYVRESMMAEGATLRSAWDKQLQTQRKGLIVRKVNDEVITNVQGDVLAAIGS